ncbi:MAG: hypothetical protein V4632_19345 [Pseudomonadota bacterium]
MRNLVLLLSLVLSACVTSGPRDTHVAVSTVSRGQPLAGADCSITNSAGSWRVTTPATAPLGTPAGDLRVICNKDGYRTSEFIYRPYTSGNSSVGLGFGGGNGNVGVGLGFGFPIGGSDSAYPASIVMEMTPL